MDFVKIHRANNNVEADLIKSFLEAHDIQVYIQGYHHRSLLGFVGTYIKLDIMVPEELSTEALHLLQHNAQELLHHELDDHHEVDDASQGKEVKELRPHNSRVGFLLAFIFPGFGNLYAGNKARGQWIVIGAAVCYISLALFLFSAKTTYFFVILALIIVALIFFDASTAFIALAKRQHRNHIQ